MADPKIIDGKAIAQTIRTEIKEQVDKIIGEHGAEQKPKLAVVLVGDRKDSATYVGMKEKACAECGIESVLIRMPAEVTQEDVQAKVKELNADDSVDGILVQLPLPSHMKEKEVVQFIDAGKDVDGLHPLNMGHLALRDHNPLFKPCTAQGCVELLKRSGVDLNGKDVTVVGRSNIVGMPVSLLLQKENATVTMCHSRTKDLPGKCRQADIVVAAIGKTQFVKGNWMEEGAIMIDVGINSIEDKSKKSGYRLVGDCDYDTCKEKCSLITPVPGGVGPMTVAILMENTLKGRLHKLGKI
uniref:Uncharacterized protein n=1 Tax=Chromera velia CCMP2878 TaxID=1169474 RepID=A0A0G4FB29_9ALVE|mmetsp:Transcript_5072/g.10118  ORF Transcript_5072/g.10118 Transcript_5072/m.10118 type:complete len:298 (+) Transcript_5072:130-1023(+)|eukprot:Cvel_16008.t1-p1 / transcript=Cvel_16008.t1 / gene=Cvel_16008 / organism=Chromera_velia_CCMP2878 / gene_product=Bifunctional protein FolD, putative / transcript_product=Bifunctional protein FolD, putative / location=Cvel_scaffold1214:19185-22701(+) / protein_length=297 / sequence_SO=supercontig / SO=protein_coding / is_pseudo=false